MRGGWTWLTDKLTKDIREWCRLLHFTLLTTPHLRSWGNNSGILSNAGTSLFIGPTVQIHIDSSCFLGALEERERQRRVDIKKDEMNPWGSICVNNIVCVKNYHSWYVQCCEQSNFVLYEGGLTLFVPAYFDVSGTRGGAHCAPPKYIWVGEG